MKRQRSARDKYPIQYALAVNKRRKVDQNRAKNMAAQQAIARNAGFIRKTGAYGLRGAGGIEKKYLDLALINGTIPTTGVVIPSLNLVGQGAGSNERIGNKITIRNINIRWWFTIDNVSGFCPSTCMRFIVYVDKQCNGTSANVNEILSTNDYASFRNMDTVDRFQILTDKYVVMEPKGYGSTVGGTTFPTDGLQFRKFAWKGALGINYNAVGTSITGVRSNNVGCVLIASTTTGNVNFMSRIKYTDD